MSPEEYKEKMAVQRAEITEAHKEEALQALGPDATESAIAFWFIKEHAKEFGDDWARAQDDFNRWVTGVQLNHEPTILECWQHYIDNVPDQELAHHSKRRTVNS
jgi:hypothetical protein